MKANLLRIAVVWLATMTLASASTNDIASLVRNGLFEEEANHHLDAAEDYYKQAIGEMNKNRELVALAIFHLGECYRQEGKTEEAKAQYARILREFSDQAQLAELSKAHLPKPNDVPPTNSVAGGATKNPVVTADDNTDEQKYMQSVRDMVANSPDLINAASNGSDTPLVKAVRAGWISVVKYLIEHGAEVNTSPRLATPLGAAASNGNKAMIELLLAKGADINALTGTTHNAPLHIAVQLGYRSIAQSLLESGANVNVCDNIGDTPLHMTAARDFRVMTEILLAHHADPNARNNDGDPPIVRAIQNNHLEMVQFLIASGAKVNTTNTRGSTPLTIGMGGDTGIPIFKTLLENGADPNTSREGVHPLDIAVGQQNVERTRLLLEHGANPNAEYRWSGETKVTPLIHAILRDSSSNLIEIVRLLLEHGANPNLLSSSGDLPLNKAVAAERTNIMALLIAHHADVNATDSKGNPPLAWVHLNEPQGQEIRQMLFDAGASEDYLRRAAIFVSQKGSGSIGTVAFTEETNADETYNLYELLARVYSDAQTYAGIPFPDLAHMTINRLATGHKKEQIAVDLKTLLQSGDCSHVPKLKWGDVVLIPQMDHRVGENWQGLSVEERDTLGKCLMCMVKIKVKNETNTCTLLPPIVQNHSITMAGGFIDPTWGLAGSPDDVHRIVPQSNDKNPVLFTFDLGRVIHEANVLLISSDLSRVKVTRRASGTSTQPMVFTVNLIDVPSPSAVRSAFTPRRSSRPPPGMVISGTGSFLSGNEKETFRLKDGDVIEIPERKEDQ